MEVKKMVEEIRKAPETILMQQLEVLATEKEIRARKDELEFWKAEKLIQISNEKNEAGKSLYSNTETREAKLKTELLSNKEVKGIMNEQRDLEDQREIKRFELEALKSSLKNNLAFLDFLEATTTKVSKEEKEFPDGFE